MLETIVETAKVIILLWIINKVPFIVETAAAAMINLSLSLVERLKKLSMPTAPVVLTLLCSNPLLLARLIRLRCTREWQRLLKTSTVPPTSARPTLPNASASGALENLKLMSQTCEL